MSSSSNRTTPSAAVGSPRVLAYCHDGVGLGHLRRTLNICEHLGRAHEQATFLIATGSPYLSLFQSVRHVDHLKLPSLSKVDNDCYAPKFLILASKQVLRYRESLLLETARHFDPHVVLVDKAPLGVCGELVSTLQWIRQNRPQTRIIFGMRDIEDEAEATIAQWSKLGVQPMLENYFDEVWVYGMRDVFDVAREYRLSARIKAKLRFMGYVTRGTCGHRNSGGRAAEQDVIAPVGKRPHNRRASKQVLVTVGGGTDGKALLDTYLGEAAARMTAEGAHTVIVAGPDLPPDDAALLRGVAGAIPGVEWVDFAVCMSCRIQHAHLVVCMGGYNTLCEVARLGKPALVVPRSKPRLEQTMRAALWANRGIVDVLNPNMLTCSGLANRVVELVQSRLDPITPDLDLEGLNGISERFTALLNGGVNHAVTVPVQ